MTYDDLDLLDLNQESPKTASLFICNLVLMVLMLFVFVGILAITAIVSYAAEEVEMIHEMKSVDSSILKHTFFHVVTLMPSIMIVIQVLINIMLILYDNIDEVFFYMRENGQGLWMLKGIFGLSLLLMTGMLYFKLS